MLDGTKQEGVESIGSIEIYSIKRDGVHVTVVVNAVQGAVSYIEKMYLDRGLTRKNLGGVKVICDRKKKKKSLILRYKVNNDKVVNEEDEINE